MRFCDDAIKTLRCVISFVFALAFSLAFWCPAGVLTLYGSDGFDHTEKRNKGILTSNRLSFVSHPPRLSTPQASRG